MAQVNINLKKSHAILRIKSTDSLELYDELATLLQPHDEITHLTIPRIVVIGEQALRVSISFSILTPCTPSRHPNARRRSIQRQIQLPSSHLRLQALSYWSRALYFVPNRIANAQSN
jgi:hypothetical protein